MGRKPNQLVLEFFQRGKKLEDASNRYEHTCKRCGELHPKGRIDNLVGHLLRRCPNVTQVDRETVFFYLQQNPTSKPHGTTPSTRKSSSRVAVSAPPPFSEQQAPAPYPSEHPLNVQGQSPYGELPFLEQQQQSALDTLAEVSRRHLDYSRPFYAQKAEQLQNAIDGERALAEQALIFQLHQASAAVLQRPPGSSAEVAGLRLCPPHSPARKVDYEISAHFEAEPETQAPQNTRSVETVPPGQQIDSDLHNIEAAVAQQLHGVDNQITPDDMMMWNPTNPSGRQTFGALSAPSAEPTPGSFGLLSRHSKNKTRSRFSDTRRKEVQETRKRGACIRCRMLKKPCSEGTPCATCANVESARLWKGACLRTRLAEVFGLWSTGLFHTKASIDVSAAVQGMGQTALPGRIEARFFAKSDLCMTFAAKQYSDSGEQHDGGIWLLDEGDSISNKVEEYSRRLSEIDIEDEQSAFMSVTIQRAQSLISNEQSDVLEHKSPQGATGRSCYNLQTELLGNTVELWLETSILIAPEAVALQLRHVSDRSPQSATARVDWSANQLVIDQALAMGSRSHGLIKSQLLAATEARCSRLAKTIINELERRLLQRQQVSRFATFLSALILLNCVERITGFYRTFDHGGVFKPSLDFASWALNDPASRLWPQGEHFAELLIMLLRMRGLPPNTTVKEDGTLAAVIQENVQPSQIHGKPMKEQPVDDQAAMAAAWLDPLKLKFSDLTAKKDSPLTRGDWDMRFLSKLLLPESMK